MRIVNMIKQIGGSRTLSEDRDSEDKPMRINNIIKHLGGSRTLSTHMDIGATAIRAWVWNGRIPSKHISFLVNLSDRMGKPITREEFENAR